MSWEHKDHSMEFSLPGLTALIYKFIPGKKKAEPKDKAKAEVKVKAKAKAKAEPKVKAKK